jgi:hypothetical protein
VKIGHIIIASAILTLGSSTVYAESSIGLANQLGTVLAAEKTCGFSYDMAAVQSYISNNVQQSDMSFGSMLQMMVQGNTIEMQSMTPATLTALCAQTGRVAKFNGFIH